MREEERQPLLTPNGLAEYLSLSPRTVRDLLRSGAIPSYKLGGARRIAPADVDAWLAENRQTKPGDNPLARHNL